METGVLLVAAVTLAILAVVSRVVGGASTLLGSMFRPPELGWPSGVQEEDDARWTWRPRVPATAPTGSRSERRRVHAAAEVAAPRIERDVCLPLPARARGG